MKRLLTAGVVMLALSGIAQAIVIPSVPRIITYQGRLTDPSGTALNGAYLVKFILYDAAVGGTALWDNGYRKINVTNGLFTYNLGDSTALPYSIFTGDTLRWLGITVGADPEISPRTKLNSVPYAYKASRADTAGLANSVLGAPGIADGGVNLSGVTLTQSDSVLAGATIVPPANGYVLVFSEATLKSYTGNTYLSMKLRRGASYYADYWYWDPGDLDGYFDLHQTRVSVDTVTGGNLYYYQLVGNQQPTGTAGSYYSRVVVVFFPYSYAPLFKPPFGGTGQNPNAALKSFLDPSLAGAAVSGSSALPTTVSGDVPRSQAARALSFDPAAELQEIEVQRDALDARIKRLEESLSMKSSESTKDSKTH